MKYNKLNGNVISKLDFVCAMLEKGSIIIVSSSIVFEDYKVDVLQQHYFALGSKNNKNEVFGKSGALNYLENGRVSCVLYFEDYIHMELVDIISKINLPIFGVSSVCESTSGLEFDGYSLKMPGTTQLTLGNIMNLIFGQLVYSSLNKIKENYNEIVRESKRLGRSSGLAVTNARRLSRIKKALRTRKVKDYKRVA